METSEADKLSLLGRLKTACNEGMQRRSLKRFCPRAHQDLQQRTRVDSLDRSKKLVVEDFGKRSSPVKKHLMDRRAVSENCLDVPKSSVSNVFPAEFKSWGIIGIQRDWRKWTVQKRIKRSICASGSGPTSADQWSAFLMHLLSQVWSVTLSLIQMLQLLLYYTQMSLKSASNSLVSVSCSVHSAGRPKCACALWCYRQIRHAATRRDLIHRHIFQRHIPDETLNCPYLVSPSRYYLEINVTAGSTGCIIDRLGPWEGNRLPARP